MPHATLNSLCVPLSAILPFSMISISSASFTVCSLWAIIITVRHAKRLLNASVTASSLILSRADVGSSRMMISGSFRNNLAIASLCLCHHESLIPLSPISVSSPSAKSKTNSHLARVSASFICFSVGVQAKAYTRFSRIVPSKIIGS